MPSPTVKLKTPAPPVKLERGERMIYLAHRHWIALVRRAALPLALWMITTIVFLVRLPFGRLDTLELGLFIAGVILFASLIYIYFDWRNDLLLVTNKRVIFVDRVLFISSRRNELLMDSIENVNTETESIVARQLNYGTVVVQTASRFRNITFPYAASPEEVMKAVMSQVRPIRSGLAQDRMRQIVRKRVIEGSDEEAPPAPARLMPEAFFGRGLPPLFPPNPRRDGDSIIWHKHWIVGFTELIDPLLLLAILFVGRIVLASIGIVTEGLINIIFILLTVGVIGWLIYSWLDWLDDLYILSPNDVVDIERHPLGQENRRQASLAAIQNVTSNQPNILARILNYGDVFLETAGGQGEFSFYHVPDPDKVQAAIFDYLDNFKRRQQEKERFAVLDIIREYHLLEGDKPGETPKS